jgi:ABC-type nickel/cobalt efflux system permease component RcnA
MLDQLMAAQRWIYSSLSADLSSFAATRNWTALAIVLPLGVLFGAIHALTPGHGKAVLASYLVGSRLTAFRAMTIAFMLSLTHVGSAVILSLLVTTVVTRTLGGPAAPQFSSSSVAECSLELVYGWFIAPRSDGRSTRKAKDYWWDLLRG